MRALNIASALSGALALVMLALASHAFSGDLTSLYIGAGAQLAAACAGVAIAGRSGRLNAIAGALIVGGAFVFSGAIYLLVHQVHVPMLAPLGGAVMIAGWLTLAFTRPS